MNMNQSSPFPISDELLSAYIDGDISEAEKQQIELAIATDPEIAWQVETLRQTVALLRALPSVSLPRSFVLQEEQVADILHARRSSGLTAARANDPSLWRRLLGFLNTGNLALRNASAVVATLFLIITLSRTFLAGGPMMPMVAQTDQAAMFEAASAPAAEDSADAMAPSARMVTGEGEEAALLESQAADMEEIDAAESAMPEAAARSMSVTEEQPAAEEQPAPVEQPTPSLQTTAFQTAPALAAAGQESSDAATLRTMPVEQSTPAPQAVPEAADAFALQAPAAAGESAVPAPEMGIARAAEDGARVESNTGEEPVMESASAEEEPSVETFAAEAASDDPSLAAKTTSADSIEIENGETGSLDTQATIAPPDEPLNNTLSMADEAAATGVEAPAELAAIAAEPVDRVTPSWDVWQIMQIGVLVLALILTLLWLGSRQRSSR
jgi:hypothetical protein